MVIWSFQVQAAMEGAASAANSRSTSHAPSRAHSPDLHTPEHLQPEASESASVSAADPRNEAERGALHSSNTRASMHSGQRVSSGAHATSDRQSSAHTGHENPSLHSWHQGHDAHALQTATHDHAAEDISASQAAPEASSRPASLAVSRDESSPARRGPAAASAVFSEACSPAASVAASSKLISTSVHSNPDLPMVQSSGFDDSPASRRHATDDSRSPDAHMHGSSSVRHSSNGPLHAAQHIQAQGTSLDLAQSLDSWPLAAALHTASESVARTPPLRNHATLNEQTGPPANSVPVELESSLHANLCHSPAHSVADSVPESADLSSGSIDSDAYSMNNSALSLGNGKSALSQSQTECQPATAGSAMSPSDSGKQQLDVLEAGSRQPSESREDSPWHAAVSLTQKTDVPMLPPLLQAEEMQSQHAGDSQAEGTPEHAAEASMASPISASSAPEGSNFTTSTVQQRAAESGRSAASGSASGASLQGRREELEHARNSSTSSPERSVFTAADTEVPSSPEHQVCAHRRCVLTGCLLAAVGWCFDVIGAKVYFLLMLGLILSHKGQLVSVHKDVAC